MMYFIKTSLKYTTEAASIPKSNMRKICATCAVWIGRKVSSEVGGNPDSEFSLAILDVTPASARRRKLKARFVVYFDPKKK